MNLMDDDDDEVDLPGVAFLIKPNNVDSHCPAYLNIFNDVQQKQSENIDKVSRIVQFGMFEFCFDFGCFFLCCSYCRLSKRKE